jgi:hypothetical protein
MVAPFEKDDLKVLDGFGKEAWYQMVPATDGTAKGAAWRSALISSLALTLAVALTLACHTWSAWAMDLKVVRNQLILSGMVIGDELGKVEKTLDDDRAIDTVILRNSPGGDAPTGYRVGELFRARGLRTAISGYCYSSCSRMFLGGLSRHFTDDFPPEYTDVGFHGHYDAHGHLVVQSVQDLALKDWIIKYSDGKADPALVDRWINIPLSTGMIHFRHPQLFKRNGASTFMCQGNEMTARTGFGCEPIFKTAIELGIATSLELVKSNDQSELRASFPERPKASGFAEIEDVGKVPLATDAGRREYRRFLAAGLPRAIALSPGGVAWAWNSGPFDAANLALTRCAQRSSQTCKLYAVDNDVVWTPDR